MRAAGLFQPEGRKRRPNNQFWLLMFILCYSTSDGNGNRIGIGMKSLKWEGIGTKSLVKNLDVNISSHVRQCSRPTSVQSNLAKGRIADLLPLAAANGFVRSWPHLIHGSLNPVPRWVSPQTTSRLVHPLLHSSPVCTTHTDTHTTLRATSVAMGRILCIVCRRCGLINSYKV